jgi:hypothetical protein
MTSISHPELLEAIDRGMFLLPELAGRVEWLDIPGLQGHSIDGSDAFVSLAGASRLTTENADDAIRQVYAHFASQKREFGWIVGPLTTPVDLGDRLSRLGMEKVLELAGMAHIRLDLPIQGNPAVSIREVTSGDLAVASSLLAEAIGFTPEGARATVEALTLSPSPLQRRAYLAYLPSDPDPVAYASMIYFPNQPIVELYCAATLEKARGQGVYTSLVARRLADAHRDGMGAAVIQAVRATSAPICQKLGFEELGNLDWYIWEPEEEETA